MRRKKKKRRRRAANEEADKVVERFLYAGPRHRAVRAFSIMHGLFTSFEGNLLRNNNIILINNIRSLHYSIIYIYIYIYY